jgi:cobalt-zinc-cadmium efflux system membrane fusion protein
MIDSSGVQTDVGDAGQPDIGDSEPDDVAEILDHEQADAEPPDELSPEAEPGDEAGSVAEPANLDATGWRVFREGIHETGHGTGMLIRSGWTRLRAKLPGAQGSLGLAAWAVAAVVVVVAVVAAAADVLQKTPSVVAATAGPSTINAQPGGVGTTTPAQNLSFSVGLNISGITTPITVTGVNVINGSRVQKGQALLSLDPSSLEQNVASVKDLLTSAQLALASAESSGGSGSLYPIASLQGQVAVDQQLLGIAQGNSNTIDSPIAGSVTNLSVQPGQAVRAGTTMLQIVDTSQIDVTAGLQLTDMQSVAVGQPADIVPTGLVGVHMPGIVVAINPTATGGGLQGSVVIQTDNLASNPLPIGTQVFVRITARRHAAVSVPAIAVQNLDLAPAVFVISHGRVHVTPVTVGAVGANRVQILSGLSAGQVVAESNTQLLTNGEHVTIG